MGDSETVNVFARHTGT